MPDVSTSPTYTPQETTLEACEEYLGTEVTVAQLIEMTSEQIAAYFEQLYNEAELSDDGKIAFESALQVELDAYYTQAYEYKKQLEAIYESGSLSIAEMANIELVLAELDEKWLPYCEDTIMDRWSEGVSESDEKHTEVPEGETASFDPENPKNGDVYYADLTGGGSTEETSGSSFNTEENADWLDTDGDGYKETDPDANNDNMADDDFDLDGDIDEDDMTASSEATTTYEINGDDTDPPIESTYVSDWNDETNVLTIKVTYEDGTVNYIKLTLPDDLQNVKIACSPVPDNYESVPDEINAIMYEKTESENSNYAQIHGSEPTVSGDYYTIYDMADYTSGLSITPADSDYLETREYTVNCSTSDDIINLTFDDSVTLEFAATETDVYTNTCTLTITATDANGNKVTITINDFCVTGQLSISGGTISDSAADVLDQNLSYNRSGVDNDGDGDADSWSGPYVSLGDIINYNGAAYSGRTDEEIAADKTELASSDYPTSFSISYGSAE